MCLLLVTLICSECLLFFHGGAVCEDLQGKWAQGTEWPMSQETALCTEGSSSSTLDRK